MTDEKKLLNMTTTTAELISGIKRWKTPKSVCLFIDDTTGRLLIRLKDMELYISLDAIMSVKTTTENTILQFEKSTVGHSPFLKEISKRRRVLKATKSQYVVVGYIGKDDAEKYLYFQSNWNSRFDEFVKELRSRIRERQVA